MNVLEMLLQSQKGGPLDTLTSMSGLKPNQMQQLLGQVLPVLAGGIKNGAATQNGLDGLMGALTSGRHDRYYDQPDSLSNKNTLLDGNGILGHILGNKDASRSLAGHAASNTGIDSALIKKLLPVIATVVMGAMNKRASSDGLLRPQQAARPNSGMMDLLSGFLDVGGDGSIMDDVLRIGAKALVQ
ncbi:MAG: DUF937 domain-containing protein [Gammaproteobacteria bacterium]|nr:MAG: DUF937 domain-containing protein [Gammaproteobacteria bacterium]